MFMGEHRFNGNSIAKANGLPLPPRDAQQIRVMNLGDDYVVAADSASIEPAINKEGELCFLLTVMAGKNSPVAGLQAGKFIVGEVGKLVVADIKAKIDKMIHPSVEDPAPPAEEAKAS